MPVLGLPSPGFPFQPLPLETLLGNSMLWGRLGSHVQRATGREGPALLPRADSSSWARCWGFRRTPSILVPWTTPREAAEWLAQPTELWRIMSCYFKLPGFAAVGYIQHSIMETVGVIHPYIPQACQASQGGVFRSPVWNSEFVSLYSET